MPVHGTEEHEVEGYRPPSPHEQMSTEYSDLQHHAQYVNQVQQALQDDYNSVDWQALEQQSPGDAVNLRNHFQQRKSQVEASIQEIQSTEASLNKRAESANANYLTSQIPAWQNAEVAKADIEGISQMLRENNYSEQEIASITDVRTITMLYDQYKAKQDPHRPVGIQRSQLKRRNTLEGLVKKAKVDAVRRPGIDPDPSRVVGNLLRSLGHR